MNFINLTGLPVDIVFYNGYVIKTLASFEPAGLVKIGEYREGDGITEVKGENSTLAIPLYKLSRKIIGELPQQKEGVGYIVSLEVAQHFPHRDDLYVPTDPEHYAKGNLAGYRVLARLKKERLVEDQFNNRELCLMMMYLHDAVILEKAWKQLL